MFGVNESVEITSCPVELRRFDAWEQNTQLRLVRWTLHGPAADDVFADSVVHEETIQHNFDGIVVEFPLGEDHSYHTVVVGMSQQRSYM